MQGKLQEIGVYDLLQLIELGQGTGMLTLLSPEQNSSDSAEGKDRSADGNAWIFQVFQGKIVHAAPSNIQSERLQDYLHRLSLKRSVLPSSAFSAASSASLRPSVAAPVSTSLPTSPPSSASISLSTASLSAASSASLLVDCPDARYQAGIVPPHPEYALLNVLLGEKRLNWRQYQTLAQRLIEETLLDTLDLCTGSFRFETRTEQLCEVLCQPFSVTPGLIRLQQDLQAWKQLYPLVKHPNQRPTIVNPALLSRQLSSEAFRNLTRWTKDSLSLRRLARRLNRPDLAVAQAVYPYLERNIIRLDSPHP